MTRLIVSEVDRLVEQASVLHNAGQPQAADHLLRAALAWDPLHPLGLTLAAERAIQRHDHETAIRHATMVLAHEPHFAPALSHLAHGLWLAGRPLEALAPARRAVEIQPGNPLPRLHLGQLCGWLGLLPEAEAAVRPLLEQDWHPRQMRARAHGVLGEALTAQGAFDAAHRELEQAIALAPEYDPLQMAYGLSLLRLGRLEEGWIAYARRERIGFFFPGRSAGLPGIPWRGQSLAGKTILLKDEQGYGDAIQFFRYLPLLRPAGAARVVLATLPSLSELFRASTQLAEVVTAPDPTLVPDFYCLTADLPGGFRTGLGTIPAAVPYIRPPAAAMRAGFDLPAGNGPAVGLAWSGDPRHLKDHLRSIPAAAFLRVADLPGIRFVSLQNAVRPRDLAALDGRPMVVRLGERLADFAAAAALVSRLDLVITVDTAIAHLAGAMGKPVWVLVPRAPDWRWLIDRSDSPWYPTMRLFRAGADGWEPVIERLRAELASWAA
jgi:tetratricopeptide (TPR) repeat protein